MPDGLYDRDVLAWSAEQADLLGRLARGERVNDAVDWAHVIEEVRDVGISELRSCQSFLLQAMLHLLKLHGWPGSMSAHAWRHEVGVFLDDAALRFSPSMRQEIGLDRLYARVLRRLRDVTDAAGDRRPGPDGCPFTLDALLEGNVDVLLAMVRGAD